MEIFPNVHFLPIVTPTLPPHPATNSFLVGRDELILIDAGTFLDDQIDALLRYVETIGAGPVSRLLCTHRHIDHVAGAADLRRRIGLTVGMHVEAARRAEGMEVDFTFEEGDRIDLGSTSLRVLHTPGHSAGHTCFLFEEEGILFTGDTILGMSYVIIVPPEGDMALYLDSLARLRRLELQAICPGHGPVIHDPAATIERYIAHRLEREQKILEALSGTARTIESIVKGAYDDTPEAMLPLAQLSAKAHLIKLVREGKARETEREGLHHYGLPY